MGSFIWDFMARYCYQMWCLVTNLVLWSTGCPCSRRICKILLAMQVDSILQYVFQNEISTWPNQYQERHGTSNIVTYVCVLGVRAEETPTNIS